MDLMTEIGIHVNTETKEIVWKGHRHPLLNRGDLQDKNTLNMLYNLVLNLSIKEAKDRMQIMKKSMYVNAAQNFNT
jgi:hypothetical protein